MARQRQGRRHTGAAATGRVRRALDAHALDPLQRQAMQAHLVAAFVTGLHAEIRKLEAGGRSKGAYFDGNGCV
jgi:hypothetical protein